MNTKSALLHFTQATYNNKGKEKAKFPGHKNGQMTGSYEHNKPDVTT